MMPFIQSLDMSVLQSLYVMRDARLVHMFIGISELGTALTVYGLTVCIGLLLLLYRKYAVAAGLALAMATSGLAVVLGKGLIERARPPVSFRAYTEIWYSFPSAHAALSAALYGYVLFLVWMFVPSRWLRIMAAVLLPLLIATISFSRIYLGVHYLTDVVAGVLLGIFCAWLGYRWTLFTRGI